MLFTTNLPSYSYSHYYCYYCYSLDVAVTSTTYFTITMISVVIGSVSQSEAYGHVDDGMSVLLGRVDGTMICSDIFDVPRHITCLQHVLRL